MNTSVMVCMPTYRMVDPECMLSANNVVLHSRSKILNFKFKKLMYIDQARNLLTIESLQEYPTHILWLDDDMIFPVDMLDRLLERKLPIVGAMYFRKMPPYDTACGNFISTDSNKILPLSTLPPFLQRTDCLGLGATLISTNVLFEMRDRFNDQEWFKSERTGEDVHFFLRCRQMKIHSYIDGEIICGHQVSQLVTDDHWKAYHREVNKSPERKGDDK